MAKAQPEQPKRGRGRPRKGLAKASVSLRPDQIVMLRFIAGHMASRSGAPADVSSVLREAIDASTVLAAAYRDAAATFLVAETTPAGWRAVAEAIVAAEHAGADTDAAHRAMFDAAEALQDGTREHIRDLLHALNDAEVMQVILNVLRIRHAQFTGTWAGLDEADPGAILRRLPDSAFKPAPQSADPKPQKPKKRSRTR